MFMKKSIAILLIMSLFIVCCNAVYAGTSTEEKLVSDKVLRKIEKALEEYQTEIQREKLTKDEVEQVLSTLSIDNLTIYSEEELQSDMNEVESGISAMAYDIDAMVMDFFTTYDTPSRFDVTFTMKNWDLIDIHDAYTGTVGAFVELVSGSGQFVKVMNRAINETSILPQSTRTEYFSIGLPVNAKALYKADISITDGGNTFGPYTCLETNSAYKN